MWPNENQTDKRGRSEQWMGFLTNTFCYSYTRGNIAIGRIKKSTLLGIEGIPFNIVVVFFLYYPMKTGNGQLCALRLMDMVGDGQDEIVACWWDGTTGKFHSFLVNLPLIPILLQ